MTGWHEGPMLALDFESTGIDPTECRAVTVALAKILPGQGAEQHQWLIDPGCDIPEGAAAIHGITTEQARAHGQPPGDVLAEVADVIEDWFAHGSPLVAFNAAYDCTLLEAELARNGLPTIVERCGLFAPVIDPFILDKHVSYRKGSRKLVDQCAHYGVRIGGAHDAGHDAIAAARVAWRIATHYPSVAEKSAMELHDAQVVWADEQATSFREYRRKQGKPFEDIDGRWPVRLVEAGVPA